ncbi:MAG: amino acid adenylation domain-containing protein [Clostridia bacterium]|nr:amino acid adenylation domain-containing protein [Clostridia bacterium]
MVKYNLTSSQFNFYTKNTTLDGVLWSQGVLEVFPEVYSYEQLNNAYNRLILSNDSLRVKLVQNEDAVQTYVEDFQYVDFPFIQVETDEELMQAAEDFLNTPIDIYERLVRCTVFQTKNSSGVMICAHHLVVDGYSAVVMAEQINHYLKNPEYIPPAYQSFGEYLEKEESHRTSKRFERDRKFWSEQFASAPVCDFVSVGKSSMDFFCKHTNIEIPSELFAEINFFCKKYDITPSTFFNTVYAVYLSRKYDLTNFSIGVPVLNRTTQGEMNMVGLYMHIVPLIINLQNESFVFNAQRIQDSVMSLFRHQKFTQQDIKELLKEEKRSGNILFEIVSDYLELPHNDDYEIRIPYSNTLSVPMEMHLQNINNNEYLLKVRYRTAFFSENEVSSMLASIMKIAEEALKKPDECVFKLEMLADEEKDVLLHTFNDTAFDYGISNDTTLYSLFEKTAKTNPEKVCLTTAEGELTFGELLTIAESLDREIQKTTKGEKCVIPVIAQRSPEMYAAIYGIIRGGNAYLPIADDYPQDRIDYILENSGAPLAVTQGKYTSLVKNISCINMTQFIENYEKTENILSSAAKEDDTAYVIYTSGSTGNPKGARVSHKSAVNRILWMHEMYPLTENDVILQKTPYTFDVSVWELFWWGMVGGKLAASKPLEHFLPAKILDEVYKNKVTHLHFVPSVFELFLNYLEANKEEVHKFSSVRYVFLSGEALSAELITRFYALFDYNSVGIHNLYGPTECAVDVTYYPCKPTDTNPVPIGKPIYNTQIHIVDKYMNLLPVGVKGELCIGGVNVGQGYLNNEALTAEKFVDNPFGEGKLYKTGDLAYFREDGEVIFCGRIDSQIKLNGQRIEISEIEAVISSVSQVEAAAVVVNKLRSPEMLVAFYCSSEDITQEIRELCLKKLPVYMVPSAFVRLDSLPLNQSGKLDRKLLSQKNVDFVSCQIDDSPKTEIEKLFCDLFKKALGTDNIGRNSNFFENGGTSISMISVLSEKLLEDITAAQFLHNPTPLKLAELIENKKQTEFEYLEPLYIVPEAKKSVVLLPFAGGDASVYAAFTDELKKQGEKISVYFIRYLHTLIECEKAADEIVAALDNTDISIYSHCVGSALSLHILSVLENKGKPAEHYFAGASIPPAKPTGKNFWNIVPDFVLKGILCSAGAKLDRLSSDNLQSVLQSFRKDTDFANIAFADFNGRIKTPVSVIVSKNDIFTKNYRNAKQIWEKYAENVNGVYFIDSDSHYFQSDNSIQLVQIINSIK